MRPAAGRGAAEVSKLKPAVAAIACESSLCGKTYAQTTNIASYAMMISFLEPVPGTGSKKIPIMA